MNCSNWEGLLDAYIDGQLSGALRLEFDAHRLRCRRCQQSLVMMEAITHVVTTDERAPAISDDFTDRVMSQILASKPTLIRPHWTRVAGWAVALQAAAVLALIMLPGVRELIWPTTPIRPSENSPAVEITQLPPEAQHDYYVAMISRAVAAHSNMARDLKQVAGYPLSISVSDDFARASMEQFASDPITALLQMLVPQEEPTNADNSDPHSYSL